MDAFADVGLEMGESGARGDTDFEGLIQADPDVLVFQDVLRFGSEYVPATGGTPTFDAELFRETMIRPMENDPMGQQVTAVQDGNLYPGGIGEQGPVTNLYNLDMLARQVYPERFGEFDLDSPLAPPDGGGLFDRQRVSDIVTGNI